MNAAGEPVFLLVLVPALFIVIGVGVPLGIWWVSKVDLKVLGMGFRFEPRKLMEGFDTKYVEAFIDQYAKVMPEAYEALGIKVTPKQIKDHFSKVRCSFKEGFLRSPARERAGLDDLNNDGKKDKLTGLTNSEKSVEVAVVPEMGMLVDNKIVLDSTAWDYECHNSAIQRFAGYEVSMGESFVPEDDKRVLPFLGGKTVAEMKQKRAVLDAAFATIKVA